MKDRMARKLVWGVVSAVVVLSAMPALGVSHGSISLGYPTDGKIVRNTRTIQWSWKGGTAVRSSSRVDLHVIRSGSPWIPIALGVPIRDGEATWRTRNFTDGVYYLRATVAGTTVRDYVLNITLDNTAPVIEIRSPQEGDVVVDDERVVRTAVVAGKTTLWATASDAMSGLKSIIWYLDDVRVATGNPVQFDFGTNPGQRVLKATALDKANNTATHEINVIALPGTTSVGTVPSPTPPGDFPPDPGPLPSPTVPPAPDPGPVPGPTVPPLPDPGPVPSPTVPPAPDPGPLPSPTVPSVP